MPHHTLKRPKTFRDVELVWILAHGEFSTYWSSALPPRAEVPSFAQAVCSDILRWDTALSQLEADAKATGDKIEDKDQCVVPLVGGGQKIFQASDLAIWRKRVDQLAIEAEGRCIAKDWSWFWSLAEYREMQSIRMQDFFDAYGGMLQKQINASRRQKKLSKLGAAARRKIGERSREIVRTKGLEAPLSQKQIRRHKKILAQNV